MHCKRLRETEGKSCRKAPAARPKKAGPPAQRRKPNPSNAGGGGAGGGAASAAPEATAVSTKSLRGVFVKELADIMVAFGDSQRGTPASLDALEGIAIDFVRGVITKAVDNVRAHLVPVTQIVPVLLS